MHVLLMLLTDETEHQLAVGTELNTALGPYHWGACHSVVAS